LSDQFDLVMSFQGSVSCSPKLRELIETKFDARFLFDTWNQEVMERLWEQQNYRLKEGLPPRRVLLIVDDISMDFKSKEFFAHLCQRGRHCSISVMICAVSYTVIPKPARRSLDFVFVFDLPMASCKKVLLAEFSKNASAAEFYLNRIPQYTAFVLSTTAKQELFYFIVNQNKQLPECEKFENKSSEEDVKLERHHPKKIVLNPDHNTNSLESRPIDDEVENEFDF